jgi:hypothetical protein
LLSGEAGGEKEEEYDQALGHGRRRLGSWFLIVAKLVKISAEIASNKRFLPRNYKITQRSDGPTMSMGGIGKTSVSISE